MGVGVASCKGHACACSSSQCDRDVQLGDYEHIMSETFPMWVMRIPHALSLTRVEPYEAHRESDSLVKFEEGMVVIFVSHQWIGLKRPDIDMRQFKELQHILNGLIKKASKVLV